MTYIQFFSLVGVRSPIWHKKGTILPFEICRLKTKADFVEIQEFMNLFAL